jgi:putative transposase
MRAFAGAGVWEAIRHHLVVMLREREGKEPSPSAAIVDTQSAKTTEKGGPRLRCGQEDQGRKRHIAVDTSGLLLGVIVHAADVQDATGPATCCGA